jgi:hypothetical protein
MAEPRLRVGREEDRKRINLGQDHEVDYWVKALGIDEQQLRALVSFHGHSATIIREVLDRRKAA